MPADAHPVLIAQLRKGKVEEGGKKKARKVLLCPVLRLPFDFSTLGPLPVCLVFEGVVHTLSSCPLQHPFT